MGLPSEIGDLTHLEELNLSCSSLETGELYDRLTTIGNTLKSLDLSQSAITNDQLKKIIESCPNLQTLNLSSCHSLTTLPAEIGKITNLQTLNLNCCTSLESLPAEIGKLGNLKRLFLNGCEKLPIGTVEQLKQQHPKLCIFS